MKMMYRRLGVVIWFSVIAWPLSAAAEPNDDGEIVDDGAVASTAAANDDGRKRGRLRALRERLDAASAELMEIETEGDPNMAARVDGVEQSVDEVLDRLSVIEDDLDNLIGVQDAAIEELQRDRLNWFGDYRVVMNNFRFVERTASSSDPYESENTLYPNLWSHRLRLGMSFDLLDNVRFYGRLVFNKNFGQMEEKALYFDSVSTRYPRDTGVRIERAFIDWFITDWLVFTAGRVTAPEGPPAELKENTIRSATWGVQMVEAEFETIMLTLHLGSLLEDTYIRGFYMPFSSQTDVDPFDDNSIFRDIGIKPMNAGGFLYEMKIPWIGENLIQLGGVLVPAFVPRYLPIAGTFPSAPYPESLGWFTQVSSLFEWQDIFGSGLDAFMAYNFTLLRPNEKRVNYDLGDGFNLPVGLASYDDPEENQAHMLYAGFRYRTPFFDDFSPKVGAEFNYGSRYHILFGSPSDLKINKLGTRGSVFEAYYIQPLIPGRLFARTGLIHLLRDYEGSFVGPSQAVDQDVSNLYVLLNASW